MATNIDGVTISLKEAALTAGFYMKKGWRWDIPATIGEHVNIVNLPFSIDALAFRSELTGAVHGDKLSVDIDPQHVLGIVTTSGGHAQGAKIISVSSTVFLSMQVGYTVQFGSDEQKYWVVDYDATALTITIWPKDGSDTGLANAVAQNATVKRTVGIVDNEFFTPLYPLITGDSKIGGSGIPANTNLYVKLYNSQAVAKSLIVNLAFLYGKVETE